MVIDSLSQTDRKTSAILNLKSCTCACEELTKRSQKSQQLRQYTGESRSFVDSLCLRVGNRMCSGAHFHFEIRLIYILYIYIYIFFFFRPGCHVGEDMMDVYRCHVENIVIDFIK